MALEGEWAQAVSLVSGGDRLEGGQARYRPNQPILVLLLDETVVGQPNDVSQVFNCLRHPIGKATATPSTFSKFEICFNPTRRHRRKRGAVD